MSVLSHLPTCHRDRARRQDNALFVIGAGGHLTAVLSRTPLQVQVTRHGNRNAVECVFREIKRQKYFFLTRLAMRSRRRQNHASEPSPSAGTDA